MGPAQIPIHIAISTLLSYHPDTDTYTSKLSTECFVVVFYTTVACSAQSYPLRSEDAEKVPKFLIFQTNTPQIWYFTEDVWFSDIFYSLKNQLLSVKQSAALDLGPGKTIN